MCFGEIEISTKNQLSNMTEKTRGLWNADKKNWECMVSKREATGTKKARKLGQNKQKKA